MVLKTVKLSLLSTRYMICNRDKVPVVEACCAVKFVKSVDYASDRNLGTVSYTFGVAIAKLSPKIHIVLKCQQKSQQVSLQQ